jgi:hypothetical protein
MPRLSARLYAHHRFAVAIGMYIAPVRSPLRSEPAKNQARRPQGNTEFVAQLRNRHRTMIGVCLDEGQVMHSSL